MREAESAEYGRESGQAQKDASEGHECLVSRQAEDVGYERHKDEETRIIASCGSAERAAAGRSDKKASGFSEAGECSFHSGLAARGHPDERHESLQRAAYGSGEEA
ncbi:MAG: hypothetical protein Kow0056_07060 [Coriobacteriia bacterium]